MYVRLHDNTVKGVVPRCVVNIISYYDYKMYSTNPKQIVLFAVAAHSLYHFSVLYPLQEDFDDSELIFDLITVDVTTII